MLKLIGLTLFLAKNGFSRVIKATCVFRKSAYTSTILLILITLAILFPISFKAVDNLAEASAGTATDSKITLSATKPTASASLNVNSTSGSTATSKTGATQGETDERATFTVATNNASGYELSIKSSSSTTLTNGTDSLNPIGTSGITLDTFSTNTWGYLPSYYNNTANSTLYYPITTSDVVLRETNTATSTDGVSNPDTYTIALGLKADYTKSAGTYTNNNIVLTAIANPTPYTLTYDKGNAQGTVTNLPYEDANPQYKQTGEVSATSITLSSTVPSQSGYDFTGWCMGTVTTTSGIDSCSGTTYASGATFGIDRTASNNATLHAMWSGKQYTATFYYNNKTSSGTSGATPSITSTTQTCRVTNTSNSCTVSIPDAVKNSVGQYNNAYVGVATTTGTMSSSNTDITLSANADKYYAVYRKSITNYYYNSSYTSRTIYRNQWFSSDSALATTVLSTSTTGTSNNVGTATGPGSSVWTGLATSATTTVAYSSFSAAATASSNYSNLYTIYQFNVTYSEGSNVSSIGSTSGNCKVTTSSTSCSVTLPTITPNTGYEALGWSTTKDATSGNTAAGSSYSLSSTGTTLYANAKVSEIDYCTQNGIADSNCLQKMTTSNCTSSNKTVTDARDGKTYTVKLINGQCWMTQNLRFTGTSVTSTLSNVTANKTLTYYDLATEGTSGGECDISTGYDNACIKDSGSTTTGVWYNYFAATAGTVSGSSNSTAASQDICPKNWHLPSGPNTTANTDINKLVGNTTSGYQAATTGLTAFGAVAGGYYNGSLSNTGNGYWWSANAPTTPSRCHLLYNSSNGQFSGSGTSLRYRGNFVRCVRSS